MLCHCEKLKVGVSLDHGVTLHFVLLPVLWTLRATIQAKNTVRSASASTALAQVSHQSHNTRTANCHLRGSGERNRAQRRTKVNFGRTMMQALELLQLAKGTSREEAMLNSAKIKPIALAVIKLHLSEDISK